MNRGDEKRRGGQGTYRLEIEVIGIDADKKG
jgi:hypothetical protein